MPEINTIVILRLFSTILFLITFFISLRVHSRTKTKTDVWLLISIAALILSLESGVNALEWADIYADQADAIGENLTIVFSLVWTYVAYRFISLTGLIRPEIKN